MSDALKKLKSLFIVEDETATENKNTANTTQTNTPQPTLQQPNIPIPQPTVSSAGKMSDKFLGILAGAMEGQNLAGFDYFEFRSTLLNLNKMAMDDQTRFQSAYAMAQTMGAKAPNLLDSAQHYLNILAQEQTKFQQALQNQRQQQVGAKDQEIKNLEQTIVSKQEQIKRLQSEIDQHQKQLIDSKNSIQDAVNKIETTNNDFVATYATLVGEIKADIEKMKLYLK